MTQFYKKEFQWTSGTECIERVHLREGTQLERICSTCCHTPLGFSSTLRDSFPLITLHTPLLSYSGAARFAPLGWRLNVSNVPKEKRNFEDDVSTIVSEGVAVSFIMKLMGRWLYGALMGKNKPDPMMEVDKKVKLLGANKEK
jgi:hypothetical protein